MKYQNSLLLAGLAGQLVSAARYNIHLYELASCQTDATHQGYACTNTKKRQCCNDGNQYRSAKFEEPGSTTCEDEMRIYNTLAGDACGMSLGQEDHNICISRSTQDITGAMVYVVGNQKRRRGLLERREDSLPPTSVKPDSYFFENGTVRYVVPLDSPEGRELQLLPRSDRAAHAVKFGKREAVLDRRAACPAKKGKGKDNGKNNLPASTNNGRPAPANGRPAPANGRPAPVNKQSAPAVRPGSPPANKNAPGAAPKRSGRN